MTLKIVDGATGAVLGTVPDVTLPAYFQMFVTNADMQWGGPIGAPFTVTAALPPPPPPPSLPLVGSNSGIMWGVNGHPGRAGTYAASNIATQMAKLNTLGARSYRMDLYSTGADMDLLAAVIAAAKAVNPPIKVLPILIAVDNTAGFDALANETAAYNFGFSFGNAYATRFKADVHVWECLNEIEGKVGVLTGEGTYPSDYNQTNLVKCRGLVRGMFDGIKAADPTAKVGFGNSSGNSWGVMDFIWDSGIHWDITMAHWYKGFFEATPWPLPLGTVNQPLRHKTKYGKPIWLTEMNGVYPGTTDKATMGSTTAARMAEYDGYAKTYGIEAAFLYELYDEPAQAGGEATFGLFDGSANPTAASTAVQTYLAAHPSVVYQ